MSSKDDLHRSQGKHLTLLSETFTVLQCPLSSVSRISQIASSTTQFLSLSITPEEVSVIVPDGLLPSLLGEDGVNQLANLEGNWKCFKVEGPLDFVLVGILHAILEPLKSAKISVLAVGTFNTDYFLVKGENVEKALGVLKENGFVIANS